MEQIELPLDGMEAAKHQEFLHLELEGRPCPGVLDFSRRWFRCRLGQQRQARQGRQERRHGATSW